jgi:hypothetical protein
MMAEIAYDKQITGNGDLLLIWSPVTENDTFQSYGFEEVVSEISVHVKGTFGGATFSLTGSNHAGNTGPTLQQIGGTDAEATVEDIFSLLDRPLEITPTATSGSSQSLSVYMLIRK